MKGGDQLEVFLNVPVAGSSDDGFSFVLIAPSFEAWGMFQDGYIEGSPAQKADLDFFEVADCSGSTLHLSIKIEAE